MTRATLLYIASFGAHVALAAGVSSIKGPRIYEDVSVAVFENTKETPKPPPPPPVEAPTPEAPKAAARAARAAKAPTPAPAPETAAGAASDIPDLGFTLGGEGGPGGLAVPAARPESTPASSVQTSKKVLGAPAPKPAEECVDPPTKPKVRSLSQPAYTPDARSAGIAGKVRVELTVDPSGNVSSARILEGLGHGLDEAALASARAATFEPGTKCGKPATTTFVIAMRFAL